MVFLFQIGVMKTTLCQYAAETAVLTLSKATLFIFDSSSIFYDFIIEIKYLTMYVLCYKSTLRFMAQWGVVFYLFSVRLFLMRWNKI